MYVCATGQAGLGKSTLINSLFMTNIYDDSAYETSANRMPKTTQVGMGGANYRMVVMETTVVLV